MTSQNNMMSICVVIDADENFAQEQWLDVPVGSDAKTILAQLDPTLDPHKLSLGNFGKVITADTVLMPADRLEVYQPLRIDPKEARRIRAEHKKKRKDKNKQG